LRILNRYIRNDFLAIFGVTLGVLTFVMCVGLLLRAVDLIARGLPGLTVLRFFVQNVPEMLTFSIPISILTSCLLLFGRLSTDSEMVALRASGVGLNQLIAPILLWSFLLGTLCLYFTCYVSPEASFANRQILKTSGEINPIALLEEGRFIEDIPGFKIYIAAKEGEKVRDVLVYELEKGRIKRSVRAETGTLRTDPEAHQIRVDLYKVRIEEPGKGDAMDPSQTQYIAAEHYPLRLDFEALAEKETVTRKNKQLPLPDLLESIHAESTLFRRTGLPRHRKEQTELSVELGRRLTLALSCITFALLGIPLGISSHRKESSAGIALSLAIVMVFYFFIVLGKALGDRPELHPELILWIPVIGGLLIGLVLLHRLR